MLGHRPLSTATRGSAELRRVGERTHTLKKLFNLREGWRPDDDWLPPRLLSESLPTGVAPGIGLSTAELRDEYVFSLRPCIVLPLSAFILEEEPCQPMRPAAC